LRLNPKEQMREYRAKMTDEQKEIVRTKARLYARTPTVKERHHKRNRDPKIKIQIRNWRTKRPYETWVRAVRNHHKKQGYELRFSFDELVELGKRSLICDICETIFDWNYYLHGGRTQDSPTLDRMDNEKILNMSNIQIVCMRCNLTKNDRTMTQFVKYCDMVVKKFSGVNV
jgi:hypothetical protein